MSTHTWSTVHHNPSQHRQFRVVDPENLLGSPRYFHEHVAQLRTHFDALVPPDPLAQTTIGASHPHALLAAGLGWPATRRVWYPGRDGADRALIEVLQEAIDGRFGQVVIGSGDGAFAPAAARLAARGCRIIVISRRGSLSAKLRLAAHEVRYLPASAPAAVATMRAA